MTLLKYIAEYKKLEKKIEELNQYKELYMECSDELIKADAKVMNQQKVIDDTRKTLERLTQENERLKWLLVSEWNV